MIKKRFILIVVLVVLFGAQQLRATGFAIFEIGARAAALAGAYVAHVDDASTVYYNPAGMVFLDGVRAKTNILFSSLTTTASQDSGVNYESNLHQIRGAHFFTWNLFDRFSIGLGIFNPYIAETNWMKENPYSYITKFNIVTIRPALALKIFNGFSLGFGIDFDIAALDWAHSLEYWPEPFRLYRYRGYYELNGSGMGFVAGILWKIGTKFQIGGRYQHKVKSNLSGSYYSRSGLGLPFSNVIGDITLPSELVLGLKFVPLDNLVLCLDFHWSGWSKTKGWELQFDETQENWSPDLDDFWINALDFTIESAQQYAEQKLKDTWNIKLGMEYTLSDKFSFRTGYAHHPSAVLDSAIHPIYPDLERKIITFGFGYEGPLFSIWNKKSMSELSMDVFAQYVKTKAQASSLPGFDFTFDNDFLVIGLGLGFNF